MSERRGSAKLGRGDEFLGRKGRAASSAND